MPELDENGGLAEFGPEHPLLVAGAWAAEEMSRSITAIRNGSAVVMTVATAIGGVHLSRLDVGDSISWAQWTLTLLIGAVYIGTLTFGFSALSPAPWNQRPSLEALARLASAHREPVLRRWLAWERIRALRSNRLRMNERLLHLKVAFGFAVVSAVLAAVSVAIDAVPGG